MATDELEYPPTGMDLGACVEVVYVAQTMSGHYLDGGYQVGSALDQYVYRDNTSRRTYVLNRWQSLRIRLAMGRAYVRPRRKRNFSMEGP